MLQTPSGPPQSSVILMKALRASQAMLYYGCLGTRCQQGASGTSSVFRTSLPGVSARKSGETKLDSGRKQGRDGVRYTFKHLSSVFRRFPRHELEFVDPAETGRGFEVAPTQGRAGLVESVGILHGQIRDPTIL
jgi:hypothetical protein